MREGFVSNACDTIGDGNGGETRTIREGPRFNVCDTVRDIDGGEAETTRECAII